MAQKRVMVDCRETPSVDNCSLTIAGTEDEVMKVAVRHAIEEHGHADSDELRSEIRKSLHAERQQQQRLAAS